MRGNLRRNNVFLGFLTLLEIIGRRTGSSWRFRRRKEFLSNRGGFSANARG